MNENAGTASPDLSVSQLVTGIGKMVFDISKQTAVMAEKLDALEKHVSQGLFERLDRIASMLEVLPASSPAPSAQTGDAVPAPAGGSFPVDALAVPLQAGLDRLATLEEKIGAVEKAVQEAAAALPTIHGPVLEKLDPMLARLASIEEKAEGLRAPAGEGGAGVPDAVLQSLSSEREKLSADLGARMISIEDVLKGLSTGIEEGAKRSEGGMEKGIEALSDRFGTLLEAVLQLGQTTAGMVEQAGRIPPGMEEIRGSMGTLAGTLEETIRKASSGSLEPVAEKLAEISGRVSEIPSVVADLSEKVGALSPEVAAITGRIGDLAPVVDGISVAVAALPPAVADISQKVDAVSGRMGELAPLVEGISGAVAALPPAVGDISTKIDAIPSTAAEMQKALADQVDRLSEATAGALGEHKALLDDMRITIGESAQDQERTLGEMTGLLKVHRDELLKAQVEDLNNEAIHHFNEGRMADAAEALEKALQADPERPELWANLAHVRVGLDAQTEAEECFRKALSIDPGLEPALSGLGLLMVRAGRPRETLDFLSRYLEDASPSARVALACARAMAAMDRHVDAINLLERAIAGDPGNPDLEAELALYREKS